MACIIEGKREDRYTMTLKIDRTRRFPQKMISKLYKACNIDVLKLVYRCQIRFIVS